MPNFPHVAVLVTETKEIFSFGLSGVILDGTGGGGEHIWQIAKQADSNLIAVVFDRDQEALAHLKQRLAFLGDRLVLVHANYADFPEVLRHHGIDKLNGAILDLGISSNHLKPERGFSYREDGPLDMRMDNSQGETARDLIARLQPEELVRVLEMYGEVRKADGIARAMKQTVRAGGLRTTDGLVQLIKSESPTVGAKFLSRVFQALRIAVNGELENLELFLETIPNCLAPGSRLAIISFHSLEDRIVKHTFRDWKKAGKVSQGSKKPIVPQRAEVLDNKRSRSAKLRWVEMEG